MRKRHLLGLFLFVMGLTHYLLPVVPVSADSLWNDKSKTLYALDRPRAVGDLVTIVIDEESNASNVGDTRSDKRNNLGINTDWQLPTDTTQTKGKFDFNGDKRYQGRGRTTRTTKFTATITAQVVEVKPNGDLYVVGKRTVRINDETETIQISGIVRPADVMAGNQVLSSQIAQAQVALSGKGPVSDPQSPGLMGKIFGFLF
jgi:flagellar L-ring protein precursor FlgH